MVIATAKTADKKIEDFLVAPIQTHKQSNFNRIFEKKQTKKIISENQLTSPLSVDKHELICDRRVKHLALAKTFTSQLMFSVVCKQ